MLSLDWHALPVQMLMAGNLCSPLKGILFWRWDGVTAAVQDSSVGDNALNVATSSDVFQVALRIKSLCGLSPALGISRNIGGLTVQIMWSSGDFRASKRSLIKCTVVLRRRMTLMLAPSQPAADLHG